MPAGTSVLLTTGQVAVPDQRNPPIRPGHDPYFITCLKAAPALKLTPEAERDRAVRRFDKRLERQRGKQIGCLFGSLSSNRE